MELLIQRAKKLLRGVFVGCVTHFFGKLSKLRLSKLKLQISKLKA